MTTASGFLELISKNALVSCLFFKCDSPNLVLKSMMMVFEN